MKNIFKWLGIALLIAAIGFTMGSCSNGSNGGGGGSSIEGTWKGTVQGYNGTLTATSDSWVFVIPGVYSDNGSYAMTNDSTARLECQGYIIGTATLQGSNTLKINLNRNADPVPPGTYNFTRAGS